MAVFVLIDIVAVLVGNVVCVRVETAMLLAVETTEPFSTARVVSPVTIAAVLPEFVLVVVVVVVALTGPLQLSVVTVLVHGMLKLAIASNDVPTQPDKTVAVASRTAIGTKRMIDP